MIRTIRLFPDQSKQAVLSFNVIISGRRRWFKETITYTIYVLNSAYISKYIKKISFLQHWITESLSSYLAYTYDETRLVVAKRHVLRWVLLQLALECIQLFHSKFFVSIFYTYIAVSFFVYWLLSVKNSNLVLSYPTSQTGNKSHLVGDSLKLTSS